MTNSQLLKSRVSGRVFALLLILLFAFGAPPAQAESLGITVDIDTRSDETNYTTSREIWWAAEPGEEGSTRDITIRGSSDVDQLVTFSFFQNVQINSGATEVDRTKSAESEAWFSYSPNPVIVPAGGEVKVSLTHTIPAEEPLRSISGVLSINATKADFDVMEERGEGAAVAVVQGGVAIEVPYVLGIGTASSLIPNFEIRDVRGVLIDDQRYLRILFENNGTFPLILAGDLQLSDPVFQGRNFGPYDFKTQEVLPDTIGFIDIPADSEISEGEWLAYVTAEQYGVRKAELFEISLAFKVPSAFSVWDIAWRAGLFIVSAALLVFAYRTFRNRPGPTSRNTESLPSTPKAPRTPKVVKRQSSPAESSEPQLTPSVEELATKLGIGKRPARESVESAKTVRQETKPATSVSTAPPPAIEDPWEFLLAARQARWSEASGASTTNASSAKAKSQPTASKAKKPAGQGAKRK